MGYPRTSAPEPRILSESDTQYQLIADQLGLEILQCGIDYYNNSKDDYAAYKAEDFFKHAQNIIVGEAAKSRCHKNLEILEATISELPPFEVLEYDKIIKMYIKEFASQPTLIKYSIKLMKDCAPHLVCIKEILGSNNKYYLNISTSIVENALSHIVEAVNNIQKEDSIAALKSVLREAWRAQLYMDKFDLKPDYKKGRFKDCRKSLHSIITTYKGFDDYSYSVLNQCFCGWCNDFDVSDLDLRTDNEFYSSCETLSSYRVYIQRFPQGKHVAEAKEQIETLSFQEAETIADFKKFIQLFPQSKYILQAKTKIKDIRIAKCKEIIKIGFKCMSVIAIITFVFAFIFYVWGYGGLSFALQIVAVLIGVPAVLATQLGGNCFERIITIIAILFALGLYILSHNLEDMDKVNNKECYYHQ